MCTAATYRTRDHYFGRTLDYEFSYGDQVVILPRSYPLHYLEQETQSRHYAMIGMACVMEDTPLFYDAVNEKGLAIAGLNFVGNACYHPHAPGCLRPSCTGSLPTGRAPLPWNPWRRD